MDIPIPATHCPQCSPEVTADSYNLPIPCAEHFEFGVKSRKWTDAEENFIVVLLSQGYSPWNIAVSLAETLRRTWRSVDTKARKLKRR